MLEGFAKKVLSDHVTLVESNSGRNDNRMKFYRYNARNCYFSYEGIVIEEDIWFLQKETPKGYWIVQDDYHGFVYARKWVSKTARKRFAYPTKEEALNSLYHRKLRQISILENQLRVAKATTQYFKRKNEENQPVSKFKMPSSSE